VHGSPVEIDFARNLAHPSEFIKAKNHRAVMSTIWLFHKKYYSRGITTLFSRNPDSFLRNIHDHNRNIPTLINQPVDDTDFAFQPAQKRQFLADRPHHDVPHTVCFRKLQKRLNHVVAING